MCSVFDSLSLPTSASSVCYSFFCLLCIVRKMLCMLRIYLLCCSLFRPRWQEVSLYRREEGRAVLAPPVPQNEEANFILSHLATGPLSDNEEQVSITVECDWPRMVVLIHIFAKPGSMLERVHFRCVLTYLLVCSPYFVGWRYNKCRPSHMKSNALTKSETHYSTN